METNKVGEAVALTAELSEVLNNTDLTVAVPSLALCVAAASHMMDMDVDEFLSHFAEDVRRIRAEVFDEKETLQ